MKKFKVLFLLSFVFIMLFILFDTNKVYGMENNESEISENYNINQSEDITFYDSAQELKELLFYYENELLHASESEQVEINNKIQKLEELILLFSDNSFNQSNVDSYELGNDVPRTYFHISPDCTCDTINYLMESPCYNCELYYNALTDVTLIMTGFSSRGWKLAADLMLHNMSNTVLDSYYTPSQNLVDRVAQCTQILDEVALSPNITAGFVQKSPGRLNGMFVNEIEGDVFNALGKFYNEIEFNKEILSYGWVPMEKLEQIVENYIAEQKSFYGLA